MPGMTTETLPSPFDHETADRARTAEILSMAAGFDRMLLLAASLIETGRQVELAGIESGIGRLCACVLDLPPEQGRAFRAELASLLARLDAAEGALRRRHAPGG
jgi:hypothetical protein